MEKNTYWGTFDLDNLRLGQLAVWELRKKKVLMRLLQKKREVCVSRGQGRAQGAVKRGEMAMRIELANWVKLVFIFRLH